jgi:hypothetical protein
MSKARRQEGSIKESIFARGSFGAMHAALALKRQVLGCDIVYPGGSAR